MTYWRKPTSWSKLKLALSCPLRLQWSIEKKPFLMDQPNYYAHAGILSQKVFELFFNNNYSKRKKPNVTDEDVLTILTRRTLVEKNKHIKEPTTYPSGKGLESLNQRVSDQVNSGMVYLKELNLLQKEVRSEVLFRANFRGFPMAGKLDFVVGSDDNLEIYDGKGAMIKGSSDPGQILFYALMAHSSGKKVKKAGFVYWYHGFEEIDVSPSSLKEFVEGPFQKGKEIMMKLKRGLKKGEMLDPNPSESSCRYCPYLMDCEVGVGKEQRSMAMNPKDLIRTEPLTD